MHTSSKKQMSEHEKKIGRVYDNFWFKFSDFLGVDESLGIHLGFYKPGIRKYKDQVINMNKYVGRLLNLEIDKSMKILDAGCGVGGTTLYLANNFKNIEFTGITVSQNQVKLAKKFAKQKHIINAKFILGSYLNAEFPDNYFDGIFALESSAYTENYNHFLDEMARILKPNGRLVVIEGFCMDVKESSFIKKVNNYFYRAFGGANLPHIKDYKDYLKEKGFKKVEIHNITKNILPTLIFNSIVIFPFFIFDSLKNIVKYNKDTIGNDYKRSSGANFSAIIMGIVGYIKYLATVSVKS